MKKINNQFTLAIIFLLVCFNVTAQRAFTERFSENTTGNVAMVGNSLLTCDSGTVANCATIQDGTVSSSNAIDMIYIDVDPGIGFTYNNSSTSELILPAGSTVLFAGLYWAARDDTSEANRGNIQLKVPLGSYTQITASVIDTDITQGSAAGRPYQAFADVTTIVSNAGAGNYSVGDLAAVTGDDGLGFYGGWALLVAYKDNNQAFRKLSIYDGAVVINGSTTESVTVNGLLTPSSGAFNTFLGALVWEGDVGFTNDQFIFEGTPITDTENPVTNFWNSSITNLSSQVTTKNPDYRNLLAMDLDYIDISGQLTNGATSATMSFTTGGDIYFPNSLVFVTDLHVPNLVSSLSKTANDLNGGNVEPGDVIEYTIVFENTGQDGATNTVLTDNIPTNTTYVPATINVTSADVGPSGVQNDTIGSGPCGYNGAAVVCGLGTSASNGTGGTFLQNQGATFIFRVTVDANTSAGDITNTINVLHNSQTFPADDFTGSANAVITVASMPSLSTAKALTNNADGDASGDVTQGDVLTFTVTVTNTGNIPLNNMTVSDSMISPSSNNCGTVAPLGTCVLIGTYTVIAADALAGSFSNTGTGDSDETPPVDDVVITPVGGTPSLSTAKALTNNADGDASGDVTQGDVLTFTVTVTNTGNIPLNNMTASDSMISPSSNNCGTVAPLGTCVLIGTYTVIAADALAGSFSNTGTGDSDETPPVDDVVITPVGGTPSLSTAKALTNNADGDASGDVTQGDVLTFTVTVTNTGNIPLNNMTVSDSMISPSSNNCGTVAPLGTCVLIGTYTVTAADVLAGSFSNTGTGDSDETPPVDDVVVTPVNGIPALNIDKSITDNADEDNNGLISLGDTITFTIISTNIGNMTLNNVLVEDDMILPGSITCVTVAVSNTCTLIGTYVIQQSDVNNGQLTNVATVGSNETGLQSDTTDLTIIVSFSEPVSVPSTAVLGQLLLLMLTIGFGVMTIRQQS